MQRLIDAAKQVVEQWEKGDLAAAVRALDAVLNDPEVFSTDDEIQQAREIHATDEVEIDDGAFASRAEGEGMWVSAWVWVPKPDSDEEEDDEPTPT